MVADSEIQRIARLTPLGDVLASFDLSVGPVEPREEAVSKALGLTLAASAVIGDGHPRAALALRDGYAVRADMTHDASSYAPAPLMPTPVRVDTGDALPDGADAVAALDAVSERGEALAPVAPGEGVLAANADAAAGLQLRLAGARLRRIDVALLTALGVERVLVRQPRVRVVQAGTSDIIRGAATLIASAIENESGIAVQRPHRARSRAERRERRHGRRHRRHRQRAQRRKRARTLARVGHVAFHGIGITPGETTAIGFVGKRPVLLLPGRIDAALAGWLTVGRRMLARLAFRLIEEQPFAAELARKIASPLGLAEVVAVRRRLGKVEPVAQGYLSMQALAQAEGWILVPADSEGHPAGSRVVVRPWP